jgi:hypothetical protein
MFNNLAGASSYGPGGQDFGNGLGSGVQGFSGPTTSTTLNLQNLGNITGYRGKK